MMLPHEPLRLTIVIPAYNEMNRIRPYLVLVTTYLERRSLPYELIVVDDGSTDQTGAVVNEFAAQAPAVRLHRLPTNRGKGGAVRAGVLQARGQLVLMADADGASPIEEVSRLEEAIRAGADIAIGSRHLASRDPRYRVQARWHRSVLGNAFNWTVQRLGIHGIADTQCGFKLFRAPVAQDLFSVARIDHYGFDLELLFVAQRRGYRISEVPINWTDQPGTKVRVLRDGLRMFGELLEVRRNYARGLYEKGSTSGRMLGT